MIQDRINRRGMAFTRFALLALVLSLTACSHPTQPTPPTPQPAPVNFFRFHEDGRGGGDVQTAVAAYVNAAGAQIDLLSTVYIAEPEFYQALSDRFPKYDVVAYELVGPEKIVPMEAGASRTQVFLAEQGALLNQADGIDYHRANFVHADLSKEAVEEAISMNYTISILPVRVQPKGT